MKKVTKHFVQMLHSTAMACFIEPVYIAPLLNMQSQKNTEHSKNLNHD